MNLENADIKPFYLTVLRMLASVCLVLAIIAGGIFCLILLISIYSLLTSPFLDFWRVFTMNIIPLAISIQGFALYGILNAIAAIAENMVAVGNYVRELKSGKK